MGGKGGGSQTTGYRYYFGLLMGICHGPVDELVAIKIGDKLAWQGSMPVYNGTVQTLSIDQYDLFGGEGKEGGIQGAATVMFGANSQTAPAPVTAMLGASPGFRGMFNIFFDGLVTMNNPYPKAWKFRVRRSEWGWDNDEPPAGIPVNQAKIRMLSDSGLSDGVHAMNPIHIIFQCLTSKLWGRGLDPYALDLTSFRYNIEQLYFENFGLCLKWSRRDTIESFIQLVLDHIGATLYTSRKTGLLTLTLIRGPYNLTPGGEGLEPMDPPYFDQETGLIKITEAIISSPNGGINQVIVTYHDPETDEDRDVSIENVAAIRQSGSVNTLKKAYPGVPTATLALKLAQRDLRAGSASLRRFTMIFDRRARGVEPGSVIEISDVNRGIPRTFVRIGSITDGTLTDGKITMTGVQDMFDIPDTSFIAPMPNTWVPPVNTPCLAMHTAFELPYFLIKHNTSPADLAYISDVSGYMGVMVAQGQPMNGGFKIAVRDAAPTVEDYPADTGQYCGFSPDWI